MRAWSGRVRMPHTGTTTRAQQLPRAQAGPPTAPAPIAQARQRVTLHTQHNAATRRHATLQHHACAGTRKRHPRSESRETIEAAASCAQRAQLPFNDTQHKIRRPHTLPRHAVAQQQQPPQRTRLSAAQRTCTHPHTHSRCREQLRGRWVPQGREGRTMQTNENEWRTAVLSSAARLHIKQNHLQQVDETHVKVITQPQAEACWCPSAARDWTPASQRSLLRETDRATSPRRNPVLRDG